MATLKKIRLSRAISGVGKEGDTVELSRWAADAIVNRGEARHVKTEPEGQVVTPPGPKSRKGGKTPEDAGARDVKRNKADEEKPAVVDGSDSTSEG